ncbi:MAG: ABC transporter substrate-binding protein [Angustibacter sp.]
MTRLRPWLLGLIAASLIVTACGDPDETTTASAPVSTPPLTVPTLPAGPAGRFTDASGEPLELSERVERVVCLTAICDDALSELGLRPVATTGRDLLASDRFLGARARGVPAVRGFFGEENLEDVTRARPDVVVGLLGTHDAKRAPLGSTAPLWLVSPRSWQDSVAFLLRLGALTGRTEQANRAALRFVETLASARERIGAARSATTLAIYGTDTNFGVSTRGSLIGSVLSELSSYPWPDRGEAGHAAGGATYSVEEVLARNPTVVFVSTFTFEPGATPVSEQLADNPVWKQVAAVRQGRVVEVDTDLWETGRGTRSLTAVVEDVVRALAPGAPGSPSSATSSRE